MFSKLSMWVVAVAACASCAVAASFGTVVPIHGTVSDIAVDDSRGRAYAANFSGYRVEVVDRASRRLLSPILVSAPPSAVALSPDARFLAIGEYQKPLGGQDQGFQPDSGGLTIVNLTSGGLLHFDFASPVLTVSFGSDGKALVVTRINPPDMDGNIAPNILVVDPVLGIISGLTVVPFQSRDLVVPLVTFPGETVQAAAGVSGDLKQILVLGAATKDDGASSTQSIFMRYDVPTQTVSPILFETSPPQGPRAVSVDQTGQNVLDGWGLNRFLNGSPYLWAQFPAVTGKFNLGSHVWDRGRNLIYAHMPSPGEDAVLHIVDTDNLTVRERLQLPEQLAGKSLMTADGQIMYSASISGVTILPIGQLPETPRIGTAQEDVLFRTADFCNATLLGQTLDVVSLGSAPTDFKLTLPAGVQGVTLSKTSGTTPAQVQITVDPSFFQLTKGTTTISLAVTSTSGVNLAPPVRLLINSADSTQIGRIVNVPGKIVDMLSDTGRNQLYLLRQDKNLVLVYDAKTLVQTGALRTGNTPVHMAMTLDQHYLMVGNDNSQIANVFDLNTLQPSDPILFPFGHYPRAIGVVNGAIFSITRNAGTKSVCTSTSPASFLDQIDFAARLATTPCTLDGPVNSAIFDNDLATPDGVLAASPDNNYLFLALNDGTVAQYDVPAQTWVASRKDVSPATGAYSAVNGELYMLGGSLLDAGLVPTSTFADPTGTVASGETLSGGWGIRTTTTAANGPGLIQRWHTQDYSIASTTSIAESPVTQSSLLTPPVGQIGETILSFTRSAAASQDQLTIYNLTISGLTIVDGTFGNTQPAMPVISGVVSAADGKSGTAPGGLVSISGDGLARSAATFGGYPLNTFLGSTCVTANNILMPLFFVSRNLVNAQVPYEVTGNAAVVVHTPDGKSSPFNLTVQDGAPAIWLNGVAGTQTGLPLVFRTVNGQLATGSNPVHRGSNDELLVYLTGMGKTSPVVPTGAAAPADPKSSVLGTPTATVGGVPATVSDAILTPGQAGVYQVKIVVSRDTPQGLSVPLIITEGGQSQTVNVRVVE